MANTVTLSGLTDYIETKRDELLIKASLGSNFMDYVEVMPNVKYKEALNYLDSTVVLADGDNCDWNPKGTDVFSERFVEAHPVTVQKEFCEMDFRKKFMNHQMMIEAGREKLPFEEKIAESQLNEIQVAVEDASFNGLSGVTDGWIAEVSGETSSIKVTVASGATATDAIDEVYAALTDRMLKKGVTIFVAPAMFRKYIQEGNAACCANRQIIDANTSELVYVGDSRVVIVPITALAGKDVVLAASKDALVYATDVEGSENAYEFYYDRTTLKWRFRSLFNMGTAIKYPDETLIAELN